tara:strand:+ start:40 stop:516 length:477 start_codon:yes stop_codon:yes gene_type:complete
MKKNLNKVFLILFLFITSNCGYKVLNNSEINNFNMVQIKSSGDQRINFKIKNILTVNSSKNKENSLVMELSTKKEKKVKEKNIKNEITKYEILLSSRVKLNFLENNIEKEFTVASSGDYIVGNKYSTTLSNEKRLISNLTEDLSKKIINNINLVLNDF